MNITLLIDGTNNFMRNYVTHPSTTADGEHCGGLFGFLSSLANFVGACDATRAIVVFDAEGGSQRRRQIYAEYKQGRKPPKLNRLIELSPEEEARCKHKQFSRLREYLDDLPVSVIETPNIEADDVIAYLANYYAEDRIVIASNDKDFYQCISDRVSVYKPTLKRFYTAQDCVTEFGIYPQNFALARAITGDRSDNIKGIPRVGLKTLLRICPQFGQPEFIELDSFFQTELPQVLVEHKELIANNYKVMRLCSDFISAFSIASIKAQIKEKPTLRVTPLRMKWIKDGLSFGARFFHNMSYLTHQARGAHANQ